jgi:Flp pilus assembly protein TadG
MRRGLGSNGNRGERGSELVEFALIALFFFSTVFLAFNFFFYVFAKAAVQHAVREGVRYAITGKTLNPQTGQDASIKQVVQDAAFGLLDSDSDKILVEYYAASGSGATALNDPGNIVVVSVVSYSPPSIAPVMGFSFPIQFTARAVDKVEPFPGQPPPRTLP